MRERTVDVAEVEYSESRNDAAQPRRRSFWNRLIHWHLREWLVVAGVVLAVGTVVVNALFLQTGPHPAPMFANHPVAPGPKSAVPTVLPRPRPVEIKPEQKAEVPMPARSRAEVVADIQRELAQRGFYEGPADGVYNPKTDIAIRDFEYTASLRPSTEPNENLRRIIARSNVKAPPTAAPANNTTAKRVMAVQRVLAVYGFGQIRPTGQYDPQTRAAIEEFERSQKLPVTGQLSARVTRELSQMTGRPLE